WYLNAAKEHEIGRAERTVLKDIWTGDIKTPFVEVLLAPPAGEKKENDVAESEPVRAEGLEFVALVPKRVPAPAVGQARDIEIGLRVTNVSKEQIALRTFDVIRPKLYLVSGKRVAEVKIDIGRDGTPKPSPRASLAPGASWTWEPRATLKWTNDRTGLRLSGPDGRGVAAFRMFTPLSVPTAGPASFHDRLATESANGAPRQDNAPLWTDRATTNPVDFWIAPPEKPVGKAEPAPAPVDLAKIDRTIKKEPAYKGKPEYCLLVFGPQAKTRVWLVRDGDLLYVDGNGSGDLTEAGKRWRPCVTNPAGKQTA